MAQRAGARRHEWVDSHDCEAMPLLRELHLAEQSAFGRARALWAAHGLTAAEFDVLVTLRNSPPPHELNPSDLQANMLITSGGLTKVMGQLEARGLVIRSRQTADQRIKPVRLTETGLGLVETSTQQVAASSGEWVRTLLNAEEISVLTRLLARLSAADDSAAP